MTSKLRQLILPLVALMAMAACNSRPDQLPVPRRTAYPRPYIYDTCYVSMRELPVDFLVNAQAKSSVVKRGGAVWLNIDYPRYRASVYCTFTPVSKSNLAQVLDNRMQRMYLNLGNEQGSELQYATPGGFDVALLQSPSAYSTPVQFVANNGQWVVSGTAFFKDVEHVVDNDSIAPIVDVVQRDIAYALKQMAAK